MGRYTKVIVNGRVRPAHVVLWEKMNGPIPKGCEIHHKNGERVYTST